MGETDQIFARLHGRFRIWHSDGTDLTPNSAKAQALLALLLTGDEFDRGRLWLQDKLWSTRAAPQGSASLRQTLSEIRRAFGDYADVLQSNRKTVTLDPARVSIVLERNEKAEFLEGLDVKDNEFNLWLSAQRADIEPSSPGPVLLPPTPTRGHRPSLLILNESHEHGALQITEALFIDALIKTLQEEIDIEIHRKMPGFGVHGMMVVSVQAFQGPNSIMGLRASLETENGQPIWSETRTSQSQGAPVVGDIEMLGLGNRLSTQIQTQLLNQNVDTQANPDATLLTAMAVRKMFSMRREELIAAEGLLLQAYEQDPRGVIQGWMAQLYSIQYIERVWPLDDLRDKSEEACARAMELDPQNSNVLSSVADASLVVRRNLARCAQLAKMSVAANPANPLAWWTLASAHLYYGDAKAAHQAASNAQSLAAGTRFQFWTDIQRGLAAIVNGLTIEGIQLLESSSALSPGFHPPLRYLTALYSAAGLTQSAQDTADRLTQLEPDFTFERLANDPDYPVSLMRQHGMLDAIDLK